MLQNMCPIFMKSTQQGDFKKVEIWAFFIEIVAKSNYTLHPTLMPQKASQKLGFALLLNFYEIISWKLSIFHREGQILYETSHVSSLNWPLARVTQQQGIPFETHLIFTLFYKLLILVSRLELEAGPRFADT